MGPHWEGRHLKLPARKGWRSPQWAWQQVSLEAEHKGTLSPSSSEDTAEILPGPLHPGSEPNIRVVVVALPMTKEERSSPCQPHRDWWPRRGSHASVPSFFPLLHFPFCPSLARCLQVEGKVTSASGQMASELIAV